LRRRDSPIARAFNDATRRDIGEHAGGVAVVGGEPW
jgi:hypothetical protein